MVQRAKPRETKKGSLLISKGSLFVSTGSSLGVVDLLPISKNIVALGAGRRIMVPNNVLAERETKSITTYKAVTWSEELAKHDLVGKYPKLVEGIIHGFKLGIPIIVRTYTPSNHMSISLYHEAYVENINKEFWSGRYFGPYSCNEVENLIGPFQLSPLSLVPKDKPGSFRAVHNFSFSHNHKTSPSINLSIKAEDYPCTWGTFEAVSLVISRLPPDSQASVRDVTAAYCTIPAHRTQWPGLVVRLEGLDSYAINTHNNFGLTSAGGIYGYLADAGADILRAKGIGPLSKWVDDHIFFRIRCVHLESYNMERTKWKGEITQNGGKIHEGSRLWYCSKIMPNGRHEKFDEDCATPLQNYSKATKHSVVEGEYCYDDDDIDAVSDRLGIVWEPSKTVLFSFSVPYLGFTWNLNDRMVAVPDRKKLKYMAAIKEWEEKTAHVLLEVQ
jgi:hypothetical protein